MKRSRNVIMLLVFVMSLCFISNVYAKDIVWKLSLPYKPVGVYGEAVKWFSDEINKRSQGRLLVEPYYNNALKLNVTAPLSAIKDGMVELNLTHMSLTIPEEPLATLPELPFLFGGDSEATMNWYFNDFVPVFEKVAANKWGTVMLTPFMAPPIDIFCKDPIRNMKDMEGLRIRVYGGPPAEMLKLMGASTYFISPAELYTALSQGMIKAAITSVVSAWESNFWEVLKYINRMNVTFGVGGLYMSKKAYDGLPRDLQDIVKKVGGEMKVNLVPAMKKYTQDATQSLIKNGMVEIYPSKEFMEETAKLAHPLWKKYADQAGPDAVALLKKAGKY